MHSQRLAVISLHTSPLAQPGSGDAGGMNVYVLETSRRLAERGIEVDIFTAADDEHGPGPLTVADGVTVHGIDLGSPTRKEHLPTRLAPFTAAVARAGDERGFDLVHSHYWLSGLVGMELREAWRVPLVHTSHTLGAVKNAALARGEAPEPARRLLGERQIAGHADRLIANTEDEAEALTRWSGACRDDIDVIAPGADLATFQPGDAAAARAELGLGTDEFVVAFVGRIQALKAPDVLVRAVAELRETHPGLPVRLLVVGGASGRGGLDPDGLRALAAGLGVADRVTVLPPRDARALAQVYRASNVVAVPSYSESFGLVAVEAQACGTPVAAARVGGLPVAVRDGETGLLVPGHEPRAWADALARFAGADGARLGTAAAAHARQFSWGTTADALLLSYERARRHAELVGWTTDEALAMPRRALAHELLRDPCGAGRAAMAMSAQAQ